MIHVATFLAGLVALWIIGFVVNNFRDVTNAVVFLGAIYGVGKLVLRMFA